MIVEKSSTNSLEMVLFLLICLLHLNSD
jgi:hypothetical protein